MTTAVVTGASGGIGRAAVRRFADRGYDVALLARGSEGLHAAADEVRSRGVRAVAIGVDVADASAVERAADEIEDSLGPIDVWVNNAFSSVFGTFDQVSPAEFERITQVTYLGFVNGTRAALSRMRSRNAGTIVQVGSALGHRAIPLQSAYCGAKHAIMGFSEALRCELMAERSPIRLTIVSMPAVNTPQFSWVANRLARRPRPVPPIYQPEVAAGSIVYAAEHPRRREYWVGASTALTIIGNRIAPGMLDYYLARTGERSQFSSEPADPNDGTGNLWQPADGAGGHDFGAHGRFDDAALRYSPHAWASRHRGALAVGAGAAAVVGAGAWLLRRR